MPQPDPPYVFVYGTLLPGLAPPVIADVVNACRRAGPGTVAGHLYDLGAYPGCALDPQCGQVIHGELLEVPDEAMLARFDWYEGYAAHDDGGSLFVRTTCEVARADGGKARAWIYVYNRGLSSARRVAGGRYRSQG